MKMITEIWHDMPIDHFIAMLLVTASFLFIGKELLFGGDPIKKEKTEEEQYLVEPPRRNYRNTVIVIIFILALIATAVFMFKFLSTSMTTNKFLM